MDEQGTIFMIVQEATLSNNSNLGSKHCLRVSRYADEYTIALVKDFCGKHAFIDFDDNPPCENEEAVNVENGQGSVGGVKDYADTFLKILTGAIVLVASAVVVLTAYKVADVGNGWKESGLKIEKVKPSQIKIEKISIIGSLWQPRS